MKRLFFLLSFSFLQVILAQNISIETLRKNYFKVQIDSSTCAKLYESISKTNSTDNIILGYKGAITASMANYKENKLEKLNLFNTGKNLIEQSIANDKENIELKFLRLTIQSSCPKMLGYNKQISADKNFVLENFSTIKNSTLKNEISSYLLLSDYVNENEKQKIKSMMN